MNFSKTLSFFGSINILNDLHVLRAVVSNFREFGDRAENSNFFLFAQNNPFGKLFSKIILKSSSGFLFWQKNGKFEIGLNGPSDPM